jgi:hypothetical protein
MECEYGVKLCVGPPTQDGFYYGDSPGHIAIVLMICFHVFALAFARQTATWEAKR